ncbi:RNAPII degradation factor [Elasticomyces elasticus]|nr:RNAPII degradation factor [Elasticomyces elasticus]
MSEVDTRPAPRGRSTARGGRGGFGRGGPRGGHRQTNGSAKDAATTDHPLEDQGPLGEMKKQYSGQLSMLKDMFPDWSDVDLVFALQESDGDLQRTVDKIAEGHISQFSDVKKKTKDRSQSKAKDAPTAISIDQSTPAFRGGRGRGGFDSSRGGRGRGLERGRGGFRGGRGGHSMDGAPNDSAPVSVPTTESSAWDVPAKGDPTENAWETAGTTETTDSANDGQGGWGSVMSTDTTTATAPEGAKSSLIPENGPKKSWASMFAAPKPAPVPASLKAPAAPSQPAAASASDADLLTLEEPSVFHDTKEEDFKEMESLPPPPLAEPPVSEEHAPLVEGLPAPIPELIEGALELTITPSQVPLTEDNVGHVPDASHPPSTYTAASTIASSMDPHSTSEAVTPGPQQFPISRPPMGGYATSAYRATGAPGRTASFQRRVLEQQEAVVMPRDHAIDRAAVQFGSMGLSGGVGADVDEEREGPETRTQPQYSPPSQPRAALPPAPRQPSLPSEQQLVSESMPTPKQAPGLPPVPQQHLQMAPQEDTPSASAMAQSMQQQNSQGSHPYGQYGRYGQHGMQPEATAPTQKPYDPFSNQTQPNQYDQYQNQSLPSTQAHQLGQSQQTANSYSPSEYSSYYTSEQQRQAYNQYYGNAHSQPFSQVQQDAGASQQRSTSGFGGPPDATYSAAQSGQQVGSSLFLSSITNPGMHSPSTPQSDESFATQPETLSGLAESSKPLPAPPVSDLTGRLRDSGAQFGSTSFNDSVVSSSRSNDQRIPAQKQSSSEIKKACPIISINNANRSAQSMPRYGENQTASDHNTPNPLTGGQQQSAAPSQQHQMQQQQPPQHAQGQQQYSHHYPYGHPYYNSPYQSAYQNQFGYGQHVGGYGAPFAGKAGMYGQNQNYGMNPQQSSYEQHSSSPANVGGFGQQSSMPGRDSSLGSGLSDYSRTSATQPPQHAQSSVGFGGMPDPFSRSQSQFSSQIQGYGQQQNVGQSGPDDTLKPFGELKASGPSPLGQPGRPNSAANSATGQGQSGLPPPQSHQQGFGGGYPSFQNSQPSQFGGLGGLGGQQGQSHHQQPSGYGAYGNAFGNQYGSYGGRGWGGNYGH